ncbi:MULTISPECIES: hypothetical protein [unclassified Microcoleus]|uniref:hypothetical protein n=1 Tax=unclassified Microcoleus TaxID=2642155 RepID=UPI002FD086E0
MPVLKGIALLKALMVEDNIQEKDLVDIFESESWVSKVMMWHFLSIINCQDTGMSDTL